MRLELEPGHGAEASRCRRSRECCPTSHRAESPNSLAGSLPSSLQSLPKRRGEQHEHERREIAGHGQHHGREHVLRWAERIDGVGERKRQRFGTEIATERPSICESAVAAVPEPMLASSLSASS